MHALDFTDFNMQYFGWQLIVLLFYFNPLAAMAYQLNVYYKCIVYGVYFVNSGFCLLWTYYAFPTGSVYGFGINGGGDGGRQLSQNPQAI